MNRPSLRKVLLSPAILFSISLLFLVGIFKIPSQAAWSSQTATPNSNRCPLPNQRPIELRFVLQADGSWQGEQRTATSSAFLGGSSTLRGKSLADLRRVLIENPCGLSSLAGSMTLELKGSIQAGESFELILPSNPSTGYLWEVEVRDESALAAEGETKVVQIAPRIGGLAAQIISFRGLHSTETLLRLHYRRPWESRFPAEIAYQVDGGKTSLAKLAQTLNLLLPDAERTSPSVVQPFPPASTPQPNEMNSGENLPSSFNWCTLGKCTAVRNQGNCGSCWAFSTVAVFESKLLMMDNNNQNLSEQYLVSCNTEGWGCDGGWFAHDYHIGKKPPSESQAGAVLESAFPYQARDIPCTGPYDHPYRALSWSYVNPSVEIPSVAEIKQALFDYGPLAAAVCVGSAFSYYRGGVFAIDEKSVCGNQSVNHGIVLVGWDDTQGVWILRNSWGPSWGESGYMRIRYGISNVGFGANYLVYNPSTPSTPTLPPPTTPPATPSPTTPSPTTPPPSRSDTIYLPIILSLNSNLFLLPNGDFEQGHSVWQEGSSNGYEIIYNINQTTNAAPPYRGDWAAWLGGAYDEISFIQQTVTVPSGSSLLSYWQWIASADECGYDFGGVLVNDLVVDVYPLCEEANSQGWIFHTVDLSHFQGETVTVQIRVETDNLYNSNLFVDQVGFQSLGTDPPEPPTRSLPASFETKSESGLQSMSEYAKNSLERVFPLWIFNKGR